MTGHAGCRYDMFNIRVNTKLTGFKRSRELRVAPRYSRNKYDILNI